MAGRGRRILPATLAIAGLCAGLLGAVSPAGAAELPWGVRAYLEVTGFLFERALDYSVGRWDADAAEGISKAQWRKERAALASGVSAFLRGDYPTAQDLLAGPRQSADERVAARATRMADLASIWAQTLGPLAVLDTGDALLQLRVPAGQEEWGKQALPYIRQWVAAYRALHPMAASQPVRLDFLSRTEDLAALMQVESRLLEKSGTVASTLYGHILLMSPASFPNGYFWPRVLCHEMVHWILHRAVGVALPLVLEEGIATWLEEWGLKGKVRAISIQERALLALVPSGLAAEMEQANRPFFQADSAASARMRFMLAWWRVRSESKDASPQELFSRMTSGPTVRFVLRQSDLAELLAHAKEETPSRAAVPKEGPVALAYAFYPELLPDRYAKSLDETRKQIYLADLLWGRNHRVAAMKLYMELPEPALMTPELFWRVMKLRSEMGAAAPAYPQAEAVLALFPEDPRVLFAAANWGGNGDAEMGFLAWLTNPFARETQGMVKKVDLVKP